MLGGDSSKVEVDELVNNWLAAVAPIGMGVCLAEVVIVAAVVDSFVVASTSL